MANFLRVTAERSGESELDVQQRMADHALHDVTLSSYASDLIGNFGRYVFQATGSEGILRARSEGVDPVNHGARAWRRLEAGCGHDEDPLLRALAALEVDFRP